MSERYEEYEEYEEFAEGVAAPSDGALSTISALVESMHMLESKIAETEESLVEMKKALHALSDRDLPVAMDDAGVKDFTTKSGLSVTVRREYTASIPVARADEAFAWLEDHRCAGIIKNEVKATFGAGQDEEARTMISLLANNGFSATQKRFVHPQTLKAFVKEQVAEGVDLPFDVFGVFIVDRAKISR